MAKPCLYELIIADRRVGELTGKLTQVIAAIVDDRLTELQAEVTCCSKNARAAVLVLLPPLAGTWNVSVGASSPSATPAVISRELVRSRAGSSVKPCFAHCGATAKLPFRIGRWRRPWSNHGSAPPAKLYVLVVVDIGAHVDQACASWRRFRVHRRASVHAHLASEPAACGGQSRVVRMLR